MKMNINGILEELFDNIAPNFCEDYVEENKEFEFWTMCEDFFSQIGQQF